MFQARCQGKKRGRSSGSWRRLCRLRCNGRSSCLITKNLSRSAWLSELWSIAVLRRLDHVLKVLYQHEVRLLVRKKLVSQRIVLCPVGTHQYKAMTGIGGIQRGGLVGRSR